MCGKSKFNISSLLGHQQGLSIRLTEAEKSGFSTNATFVPGTLAAVVTKDREVVSKSWGYELMGKLVYNARSESWDIKKSFKDNNPVLIPSTGFWEGGKFFIPTMDEVVYLAGLCNEKQQFVMLTQDSRETKVSQFYHRAPLVLNAEGQESWLNRKVFSHDETLYKAA